jgi:mycothiol system anti-sigma-R factor
MPTSPPLAHVATADCDRTPARAFELLDGSLSGVERAALEAHLAECRHCRAQLDHDRRFLAALRARDLVERAPPSLRRRVAALLRDHRGG